MKLKSTKDFTLLYKPVKFTDDIKQRKQNILTTSYSKILAYKTKQILSGSYPTKRVEPMNFQTVVNSRL